MATLYELTGQWLELYDMADDPEINPDVWFDTIEGIEGEIEVKAEGYAKLIRQLEADQAALDTEAARLKDKSKTIENKIKRLKDYFKQSMEATGKTKIQAGIFTFAVQKNGGKTPIEYAPDMVVGDLPLEYLTFPAPTINSEAVRQALDEGKELEWAHYGERGTHLKIK